MTGILGFTFHQGREIPRPVQDNGWPGTPERRAWRRQWMDAIEEACREDDPWGLLCTAPDGDVSLRDVLTPGSVLAATDSGRVHLLLAREHTAANTPGNGDIR